MVRNFCYIFFAGAENTELIQQRAGFDVKLQCNLKGLVDESMLNDIKIHWYFKVCTIIIIIIVGTHWLALNYFSNAAKTIAISWDLWMSGLLCHVSRVFVVRNSGSGMWRSGIRDCTNAALIRTFGIKPRLWMFNWFAPISWMLKVCTIFITEYLYHIEDYV